MIRKPYAAPKKVGSSDSITSTISASSSGSFNPAESKGYEEQLDKMIEEHMPRAIKNLLEKAKNNLANFQVDILAKNAFIKAVHTTEPLCVEALAPYVRSLKYDERVKLVAKSYEQKNSFIREEIFKIKPTVDSPTKLAIELQAICESGSTEALEDFFSNNPSCVLQDNSTSLFTNAFIQACNVATSYPGMTDVLLAHIQLSEKAARALLKWDVEPKELRQSSAFYALIISRMHTRSLASDPKKFEGCIAALANANETELACELLSKGITTNGVCAGSKLDPSAHAIHLAIYHNNIPLVDALLKRHVSIETTDSLGRTPLYLAARYGNPNMVEFLLSQGANPNAADKKGNTPVHGALLAKNAQSTQALVQAGANCTGLNKEGFAPIHYAAQYDLIECMRVLEKTGVDWSLPDINGNTAQHIAVKSQSYEVIKFLVEKAAPFKFNYRDQTPLDIAITDKNSVVVEMLLKSPGAHANYSSLNGKTPLEVAQQQGSAEIHALLEKSIRKRTQNK